MKGGWSDLFLFDARVKLVLVLLIVAVSIAGFLTYIEIKIRKRKETKNTRSVEDAFITGFLKKIDSYKTPQDKLDFLDKTAKKFLNEKFGTNANSDYSVLSEQLKKREDIVFFCNSMLGAYYSSEITEEKVKYLSKVFLEIFRCSQEKSKPKTPSIINRLEPLFIQKDSGKEKNNNKRIVWIKDFFSKSSKKIYKLFFNQRKKLDADWKENFRDINKELFLKRASVGGIRNRIVERELMLRQKEIARRKLKGEPFRKEINKKGDMRYLIYNL